MNFEEILTAIITKVIREEMPAAIRKAMADAQPKPTGEYLTPIEAGRVASVHPATIRQWIQEGLLPAYKAGREYRVRRDELDAFLSKPVVVPKFDPEAMAAAILARARARSGKRRRNGAMKEEDRS